MPATAEIVDLPTLPGVPCPCGTARRAFAERPDFPATVHLTQISRRLTEIFGHAQADKRSPARVADAIAERLLYG